MVGCRRAARLRGPTPQGGSGRRRVPYSLAHFLSPLLSVSTATATSCIAARLPQPGRRPRLGLGVGTEAAAEVRAVPHPAQCGMVTRAASDGSSARLASACPRSSPVYSCFHSSPPPGSGSGNSLSAPSCQTGFPPLVTSAALPFSTPPHRFLSR